MTPINRDVRCATISFEEHRSDIMVEGNGQRTTAAYETFRFIGSDDIMIDYIIVRLKILFIVLKLPKNRDKLNRLLLFCYSPKK